MFKRNFLFCAALTIFLSLSSPSFAGPGDYSLRVKGGPSFNIKDWVTQFNIRGEFDYDFGYSMGFNLMSGFGVSKNFRFQLIPSFRYDYAYIGPASLYGIFGAGFGMYDKKNALDLRFGTGMVLPLGSQLEFNTDVNMFVSPVGLPRTVVTLDWMIGFGMKFH